MPEPGLPPTGASIGPFPVQPLENEKDATTLVPPQGQVQSDQTERIGDLAEGTLLSPIEETPPRPLTEHQWKFITWDDVGEAFAVVLRYFQKLFHRIVSHFFPTSIELKEGEVSSLHTISIEPEELSEAETSSVEEVANEEPEPVAEEEPVPAVERGAGGRSFRRVLARFGAECSGSI